LDPVFSCQRLRVALVSPRVCDAIEEDAMHVFDGVTDDLHLFKAIELSKWKPSGAPH
jgi:hypothetical protein